MRTTSKERSQPLERLDTSGDPRNGGSWTLKSLHVSTNHPTVYSRCLQVCQTNHPRCRTDPTIGGTLTRVERTGGVIKKDMAVEKDVQQRDGRENMAGVGRGLYIIAGSFTCRGAFYISVGS